MGPASPPVFGGGPALVDEDPGLGPVAEGFDFATSRRVLLRVETSEPAVGALVVSFEDGKPIYRGALAADRPFHRALAVPSPTERLRLESTLGLQVTTATVTVTGTAAVHRF